MTKINAKQALERIRKMLFTDSGQAGSETNGAGESVSRTYTLKSGETITVTGDFATGAEVYISTSDGNQPAVDGEFELEDGTIFTLASGLIASLIPASQENPDENNTTNEMLEAKISEMEQELAAFKQTFKNHSQAQKELVELVTQLAALPAEAPVAKPKNVFTEMRSKKDAKMRELADSLKQVVGNR